MNIKIKEHCIVKSGETQTLYIEDENGNFYREDVNDSSLFEIKSMLSILNKSDNFSSIEEILGYIKLSNTIFRILNNINLEYSNNPRLDFDNFINNVSTFYKSLEDKNIIDLKENFENKFDLNQALEQWNANKNLKGNMI